jgi:hypothetical protein
MGHDRSDLRVRHRFFRAALIVTLALVTAPAIARADHVDCGQRICPHVQTAPGSLNAAYVEASASANWSATTAAPEAHPFTYRLSSPCAFDAAAGNPCRAEDDAACPAPPDRVVEMRVIEQRRLVLPDGTAIDDFAVPTGAAPGTPVGNWETLTRTCIDITALNPPPSPAEVFRYFQTLPLPDLPTQQQPPGNALAGLPVVFYTDGPTTQTFTV